MIPVSLTLSGFLSYRNQTTLDFRTFDLACISGANGAGKSSLLDAITWVLFGQARKRDESIINLHPDTKSAQVIFDFEYEGNSYRIIRTNPKGKTALLEFHIQTPDGGWKPLTERTSRDTQARIEEILRLDYDTFINAAFFLQDNADQFTQQRAGDRKRILGNILGLEIWESYRKQSFELRKQVENEILSIDGRLQEINKELAEEQERREALSKLESELERLATVRTTQESILENLRKLSASLEEQKRWVESQKEQLDKAVSQLSGFETRVKARLQERGTFADLLAQAKSIQEKYREWEDIRTQLRKWDQTASSFNEQEKRRREPLTIIETERARLETERDNLLKQNELIEISVKSVPELESKLSTARKALAEANDQLEQLARLEADLQDASQKQAAARAENPLLRKEMVELDTRIKQLKETEGAECPLCGQPLSTEERNALIEKLTIEGTEMGDRFRANKRLVEESETRFSDLQSQVAGLKMVETQHRAHTRTVDQLTDHLAGIQSQADEWESKAAPRLSAIEKALVDEDFAHEARTLLAQINQELKKIGYDAETHDKLRQQEQEGQIWEEKIRTLEKAQAALEPLNREISDLEEQIALQKEEVNQRQTDYDTAAIRFVEAQADVPNLYEAEHELLNIQEKENRIRMEVGAAKQKVLVLKDQKTRRETLQIEREALTLKVAQYKQLERAFGKDGVPALLIEQALPQIEAKANDILDRLSNGNMSVRFITQREYKDRRRDDLKETLDIQISDSAGVRDYEMYSGGEAFRVNFAIRLALSEILAQRAGARLQTLVIDEGFGSQDAAGRQRLIEAINMVRSDFEKIIVITHIDELKDAFPTRIEVNKDLQGSTLRVI